MLLRRSGTLSRGQGIEAGNRRDENREFGRLCILLRLRVGLVVEEKEVDQGFQIYGEVQEGRHGMKNRMAFEDHPISSPNRLLNVKIGQLPLHHK